MASTRHLECPQCETRFKQRKVQGVTIDYCSDCGGVWLDPGELGQLTDGHSKKHHHHDHDDLEDEIEDEFEDEFEDEEEEEEEGGLIGFVSSALGGEEGEEEEEGGWGFEGEEEEGEEEF